MKVSIIQLVIGLSISCITISCKLDPPMYPEKAGTTAPYTVISVAGMKGKHSLRDGIGADAGFWEPNGLQLKNENVIYVADSYNNAIRKIDVKLPGKQTTQFSANVTTLNIPTTGNGLALHQPARVAVSDDGTINVVFRSNDVPGRVYGRIYGTDGFMFTEKTDDHGATGLSKEVYGDYYWFTGNRSLGKFWSKHIQKPVTALPADHFYTYDSKGNKYGLNYPIAVFSCANGVKYLASKVQLYKFTNNNEVAKLNPVAIYPNMPFRKITDITATRDGRIVYVADDGSIKKVENGLVNIISPGNNVSGKNHYAWGLALDEKNKVLYFSDLRNHTINALTLPGYITNK